MLSDWTPLSEHELSWDRNGVKTRHTLDKGWGEKQSERHKPRRNTLLQSSGTPELFQELSKILKNSYNICSQASLLAATEVL